jgi:hypothetical protein
VSCGRRAFVAHGYAYASGDAYAIYFVDWCEARDDQRRAYLTLAVGDWDEGSSASSRRAVCVKIHPGGMGLTDRPAETDRISSGNFCRERRRSPTWNPRGCGT